MKKTAWLLIAWLLTGCQAAGPQNPAVQSDRNFYYPLSVVHPQGLEPNVTPYGTPTNAGTSTDYGRSLRPDAVSVYPRLLPAPPVITP